MIRQAARDFAQNELKEGVIERDSKCEYPEKQVKRMAELGFLGMTVSTKYGGGGMDTISYALAVEEISKIDSRTQSLRVHRTLVSYLTCICTKTYTYV